MSAPFVSRCHHCGRARDPEALRTLSCHAVVCLHCGCVPDPLVWHPRVYDLLAEAERVLREDAHWHGEAKWLRASLRGSMWLRRVHRRLTDHGKHAAAQAVAVLAEAMGEDVHLPDNHAYPQAAGDGA